MKKRFLAFLQQGLTPEKLAFCVGLGSVLGVMPVLGSTTLLCALAAWVFRLNQPAIQSVNYLLYPLQLALLIPFYRFGEWLFRSPRLEISAQGVKVLLQSGVVHAIRVLWVTTLHAMAAWTLVAPLAVGLLVAILTPIFRKLSRS